MGEAPLHVAFVLDSSGSMGAIAGSVVEGYNDYLRQLREQGGETLFSLTTFDTALTHHCTGVPLAQAPVLDHRSYAPGGMTALYDAVGQCVTATDRRLGELGRGHERVLVVVLTDGEENSSREYTSTAIRALVQSYDRRPNWTFAYLGAGHWTMEEAQAAAADLGAPPANAMRWQADQASARKMMSSLADATAVRRASHAAKSSSLFADAGQTESDYRDWPEPEQQGPDGGR